MVSFVSESMNVLKKEESLKEMPVLEMWDQRYGVGALFGFIGVELVAFVTAIAVAYVGIEIEVAGLKEPIDLSIAIAAEGDGPIIAFEKSLLGDEGIFNRIYILSKLFDFSIELVNTAKKFER